MKGPAAAGFDGRRSIAGPAVLGSEWPIKAIETEKKIGADVKEWVFEQKRMIREKGGKMQQWLL